MIPMNKVEITAYRYMGCVGSCFTLFQAVVWLILGLGGAICKYARCGSTGSKQTFKYCFYLMYYYQPQNTTANFTRVNYINPNVFHAIMWINVLLCIANGVVSALTIKAFFQWKNPREIKKMAYIWTRCILAFSACELILFIIFASDVVSIKQKDDVKCFLKINLTMLQSSYSIDHSPAPYLLQLKANLKTMKRKIRKYKRNLLFLDAVFDEKSPDHVKNPFIPRSVVNNYVEDIWKSMFNNSIREKVRRKVDSIPFDETMRNFIISEHLDLDDADHELLKNFDGLTNNKWIRPIQSSNVVFGRQFNLSLIDDSVELDNISNLLQEYIKDSEIQTTTSSLQPDDNFYDFFKEILDELVEQEPDFAQNKDKVKSFLDKVALLADQNDTTIPDGDKGDLSNLKKFFDSMTPEEDEHESKELNDQNMQAVINKIKEFLEYNQTTELTEEEILKNLADSLKYQYELTKDEYDYNDLDDQSTLNDSSTQLILTSKKPINYSITTTSTTATATTTITTTTATTTIGSFQERDILRRQDKVAATTKATPTPSPSPPEKSSSDNNLVKELCDNCAYFILAPSIVCMILSLKTGLVWALNITAAVLVLYFGSKIKLKTKYKFSPCLTKKK